MIGPLDREDDAWARKLVDAHGLSWERAARHVDLGRRTHSQHRIRAAVGDRFAGVSHCLRDERYHVWAVGPLDDTLVAAVAEVVRDASVAHEEWEIHGARFSRDEIRAAQRVISDRAHASGVGAIHSSRGDFRRGVIEIEVLRGTSAVVMAALRASLPATAVPVEVVEGAHDTLARLIPVSIADFGGVAGAGPAAGAPPS